MTVLAERLAGSFAALGVRRGDTLLVHSSLKSLGELEAAPSDVVEGLRAVLGEEGTLVFPTLSYRTCGPRSPEFDVLRTPCCVGAIPEYFRTLPGAVRSLCPTHSCAALGPQAEFLTGVHHLDGTPCGPSSPFARLRKVGGRVLFLGCGCGCNTSMHAVEETVRPPYLFGPPVDYRVTTAAGEVLCVRCLSHNFAHTIQRYERVPEWMETGVARGRVLAAACVLLDAGPMWAAAQAALAQDPLALVDSCGM